MSPITTEGQLNRHPSQLVVTVLTSIRYVSAIGSHLVLRVRGGALVTCVLVSVMVHNSLRTLRFGIVLPQYQLVRMMHEQARHVSYPI